MVGFAFWTGRGGWVMAILVITGIVVVGVNISYLHDAANTGWVFSAWSLLCALGTFLLARFGLGNATRTLIDPKTGQSFTHTRDDKFNGIPVRAWPYIFVAAAVGCAIWGLIAS
jgi:hypothetical protein